MEVGVVGLGKMGLNLALNLLDHSHDVFGFDTYNVARENAASADVTVKGSLDELLNSFSGRKIVWMMLPAGDITGAVVEELIEKLSADDIIIEAGNSNYKDSIKRAEIAQQKEIHYLDVGTSGGMSGARNNACLMIGGDESAFKYMEPVFAEISITDGYLYAGKSGSGHYLKMVHNGIEYGMMQAIGEGFQIVRESNFDFNLADVAKVWENGSVIRGWLMELSESAFRKDADLSDIKGIVAASGEAKWTVEEALDLGVPAPVITLSLMMRNYTQEEDSFSAKVVASLRNEFGGHKVVQVEE